MAYVEEAIRRGLRVDEFAPRLSFFFNSHNDFFEEIAKFRAARRIWYKLMTQRYRAENERSTWMRFHTQTAGVSLTAQQPLNNLTRVAIQALAAVLGGTQSLHTDAYDEAWAVPSAEAALLALRQQQVIASETGVTNTVDPLGGSWFVESLTNEVERQVWRYLDEIDRFGGMVKAIAAGYPQKEVADAAYRFQRELDEGEREIVGVNVYADPDEELTIPLLEVSEESLQPPPRAARADAPRARPGAGPAGAHPAPRPGVAARLVRGEPDARAHRLRQRLRHAGRDVRRLPRRLRGVPRTRCRLTARRSATFWRELRRRDARCQGVDGRRVLAHGRRVRGAARVERRGVAPRTRDRGGRVADAASRSLRRVARTGSDLRRRIGTDASDRLEAWYRVAWRIAGKQPSRR